MSNDPIPSAAPKPAIALPLAAVERLRIEASAVADVYITQEDAEVILRLVLAEMPAEAQVAALTATLDAQASVIAAARERALMDAHGAVSGASAVFVPVVARNDEETNALVGLSLAAMDAIAALRAEQSQERAGAVAGNHPSDTLGPKLRGWLKHFRERHGITENDKRTLEAIFAEVLAKHEADPSHDG